jgi:hypothetical protein
VSDVELPRARRVPLAVPISYRPAGSDDWLRSRIVNISESGVLFEPAALEPGRAIEVIFSSPIAIESLPIGPLVCLGKVIRATAEGAAVRFEDWRFLMDA